MAQQPFFGDVEEQARRFGWTPPPNDPFNPSGISLPVSPPMPQAGIAPNAILPDRVRLIANPPPVIANQNGMPPMPVPGGNWLGHNPQGQPFQPIPALDALMSAAAQNYRQWTPGVPYPNVDPDMISANLFRSGGGGFVSNPAYAPAMAAYSNAVSQYGQGMGEAMRTAAGQYAPALMGHQQAQARLGHDMMQLLGANGAPGTLATGGVNALAQWQNAINARNAVDVQRDQFLMNTYNEIRRSRPNINHEQILQQMENDGYERGRVLRAIQGPNSAVQMPPFFGGQGQTGQTGPGVPVIPGLAPGISPDNAQGGAAPPMPADFVPEAIGRYQGTATPPRRGGPQAPRTHNDPVIRAFELGSQILSQASGGTPATAPTGNNPGSPAVPPNYAQNPGAYHNAITTILQNMDNQQLRQNWPLIQRRLENEMGGPDALNAWIQTSNIPLNTMSGQGQRQQTQIQRLLQMAGMRQSPIGFGTTGANWTSRILGGIVNNTVGRIPGFTPGR